MGQEKEPEGRTAQEGRATLLDAERLLAHWQGLQSGGEGAGASVSFRNPDQVAAHLEALRIGPSPEGLHEAVRQVWRSNQKRWASRSDAATLRQELEDLAASPSRDLRDLDDLAGEMATRRERLATLWLLCAVLDELLLPQGDTGSGGDPAVRTNGPG